MNLHQHPEQTAWILGQMGELDRRYRVLRATLVRALEEDVPLPEIDLARNDVAALLDAMVPRPVTDTERDD